MSRTEAERPMLDLVVFQENQRKMSPEARAALTAPHVGKHIAWAADGLSIVAWGATRAEVYAMLDAAGISSGEVCHDFVDPPGEIHPWP